MLILIILYPYQHYQHAIFWQINSYQFYIFWLSIYIILKCFLLLNILQLFFIYHWFHHLMMILQKSSITNFKKFTHTKLQGVMLELNKFTIKETKHERNRFPFFVQLLSEPINSLTLSFISLNKKLDSIWMLERTMTVKFN